MENHQVELKRDMKIPKKTRAHGNLTSSKNCLRPKVTSSKTPLPSVQFQNQTRDDLKLKHKDLNQIDSDLKKAKNMLRFEKMISPKYKSNAIKELESKIFSLKKLKRDQRK